MLIVEDQQRCIITAADCSASWQSNLRLLGCIAALLLLIGLLMISLGGAMVLPFLALELIALSVVLYHLSRRLHRRQIIYLEQDSVKVEKGLRAAQSQWIVPRSEAQLWMLKHRGTRELFLCSRKERILLNEGLSDKDTEALRKLLSETLGPCRESSPGIRGF